MRGPFHAGVCEICGYVAYYNASMIVRYNNSCKQAKRKDMDMAALNDGCAGAAYGRTFPEKVVLERKGTDALVMRGRGVGSSRYVIARGFDEETGKWMYGEYFADLLYAARAWFGMTNPNGGYGVDDRPTLSEVAAAAREASAALQAEER